MADTETKTETKIAGTPEKKAAVVAEKKVEKEVVSEIDVKESESNVTDDKKNKTVEGENNGTAEPEKNGEEHKNGKEEAKSNGFKADEDMKEAESTENGSTTEAPVSDACCIKRKSTGGEVTEVDGTTEASSPKKAKLDDKAEVQESNKETVEA